MNATALPAEEDLIVKMGCALGLGARDQGLDLDDERAVDRHLQQAGFSAADIGAWSKEAVDYARTSVRLIRGLKTIGFDASALLRPPAV